MRRPPESRRVKNGPTSKQARFVAEYLADLNGAAAAVRAGYAAKSANVTAAQLLAKPNINTLISEKARQQLEKADLRADRVLEELRRLAFADVRGLFDAEGNLKPIHTLTAEEAAAIAGFEVIKKNAEAGDGHVDAVHKVRVLDKMRALEVLAKHFRLLEPEHGPINVPRTQLVVIIEAPPATTATTAAAAASKGQQ